MAGDFVFLNRGLCRTFPIARSPNVPPPPVPRARYGPELEYLNDVG